MKVTTFNSYFWTPKSKLINSSVIDYNLRSDQTILSVKDTKKPVQLYIPRKLERPLAYQHWSFQERANSARMNFHTLNVEHDNSFHIEFKPMNYCSNYQIYVKHGVRPSLENYDRNWTLPNLSLCNSTGLQDIVKFNICSTYLELVDSSLSYQYNGSETNINCTLQDLLEARIKEITSQCSSDPYKVFMLDTETKNGTYYFGKF